MFEHSSRADENGKRAKDCRGKPNTAERLAESSRAASVQTDLPLNERLISSLCKSFSSFLLILYNKSTLTLCHES